MWRDAWEPLDFVKRTPRLSRLSAIPHLYERPQGIRKRKKKAIIDTLLPLSVAFDNGKLLHIYAEQLSEVLI